MKVCKHDRVLRCVDCENENLRSKVEEMQKALEWYADEKNWGSIEEYGALVSDGGDVARQALKGNQ